MSTRGTGAAAAVLSWLTQKVHALAGTLYVVNAGTQLTLMAHHGCDPDASPTPVVPLGQGLLGAAAERGSPVILEDLDEQRIRMRTGLLEIVPRAVLVYPLVTEDRPCGVIELAFVDVPVAPAVELLDFLSPDLQGALQRAVGPAVAADGADAMRTLNEELTITTARLERMSRELHQRDRTIQQLQQKLERLGAHLDKSDNAHTASQR